MAWSDGTYKATGCLYDTIEITGNTGLAAMGAEVAIQQGDFGEAAAEIVALTGQNVYTVEFRYNYGAEIVEHGVVTEEGKKITLKTLMGAEPGVLQWMTKEEVSAYEATKDPIDAMSHPYTEQPENPGKFLWLTGPPGLGKSTSAQLLARKAGYVYYEGDAFFFFKNPYIPVDAAEPSKAVVSQKSLRGEGLMERIAKVNRGSAEYQKMTQGQEYDRKILEDDFYGLICNDIKRERGRLGGDWVVAMAVDTRAWRDFIRSRLGPDLEFVVLEMDLEMIQNRVRSRHDNDEGAVQMLMVKFDVFLNSQYKKNLKLTFSLILEPCEAI